MNKGERYRSRTIPKELLIADMKRVAKLINKDGFSSVAQYNNSGKYHSATFIRRFGSWKKALKAAGLIEIKRKSGITITATEIIEDMQRVAKELNTEILSINVYLDNDGYLYHHIKRHLNDWGYALKEAGLKPPIRPSHLFPITVTKNEVIEDLQRVGNKLKKEHLRFNAYFAEGKYKYTIIKKHLINWDNALKVAGLH